MPSCAVCDEPARRKCGRCSKVWYCSKECQRVDWDIVRHKMQCYPEAITTADLLTRAVYDDLLPTDPQTRLDYGFARAFDGQSQSYLLGLYQGLIKFQEVRPHTIHKWRVNGTLIEGIKSVYEKIPEHCRGGYYPWFLKNLWVLDGRHEESTDNGVVQMLRQGLIYAGVSPSLAIDKAMQHTILASWSDEKQMCVRFCSIELSDFHSGPTDDAWIPFGFCTCNKYTEMRLGALYRHLLHSCTFDEFLNAYKSSQLSSLFKRKGLGTELSGFPFLEDVLALSPRMHLSVWSLKQYIMGNDGDKEDISLSRAVKVDYGFMNCKNEQDKHCLVVAYKAYFNQERSPIDLHKACISGNLFNHVSQSIKLKNKNRCKRLMINPYPLFDPDEADASNTISMSLESQETPMPWEMDGRDLIIQQQTQQTDGRDPEERNAQKKQERQVMVQEEHNFNGNTQVNQGIQLDGKNAEEENAVEIRQQCSVENEDNGLFVWGALSALVVNCKRWVFGQA